MFRPFALIPLLAGVLAASSVVAGTVSGTVQGDGRPLAGARVTAETGSGIAVSVYSAADGRFSVSHPLPGPYALRVRAAGFDDAGTHAADGDQITLSAAAAADPLRLAASSEFLALLPDGEDKRRFILNCTSCHEIAHSRIWKDGKVRDTAKWVEAIKMMKAIDVYAILAPEVEPERFGAYLARHLTPERLAALRPKPRIEAATAARATITEYPIPVASELPHDVGIGPDGRLWITAFWTNAMWAMDPKTGATERYSVSKDDKQLAQVRALAFDKKGMLWIVLGGSKSVVRLDPKTKTYRTYPVGMYAHDVVLDSKGNVWLNDYFSKPERVGMLNPASGKVTTYPLPSANLPDAAGKPLPYGLQIDAKDRLWATQLAGNTLVRFDTRTLTSKLYTLPETISGPRRLAIGLDGALWIPEFDTGYLTRFDPDKETFARFNLGDSSLGAYAAAVDPRNGAVWITGSLDSSLLRFDVNTQAVERYPLPTEPAYMRHMVVDPNSGALWSAYSSLPTAVPKIVRLERRD
ncbi:MAG: carboxypeptidase regulatory-like domain-containing protein [Rhodocyclaceae bacterium]|jgi:streptogramin lyase|nr:carboxypeptidase regulatory-like domain-containing protein [Rhodocyclaceae bacterium]